MVSANDASALCRFSSALATAACAEAISPGDGVVVLVVVVAVVVVRLVAWVDFDAGALLVDVGAEVEVGFDFDFDFVVDFGNGLTVAGGLERWVGAVLTSDTNSVGAPVTRVLAELAPEPPEPDPDPALELDELPSCAAVS